MRSHYKQHGHKEYEGAGSSSQPRERESRKGYYVRKPRPGHEDDHHSPRSPRQNSIGERKRRLKQYWVPKGDMDMQVGNDAFIHDTRQKTSTVFDRISEHHDTSADPARQGRREQ